jgi:hypothetical protein
MKTFARLSGLLLLCTLNAKVYAWQKRSPEQKATYYTKQLQQDVGLDSLQYQLTYGINLRVSQQLDSLYGLNMEEEIRKKSMIPIFRSRDSSFRQVLTKRQFLMYDDVQRERWQKKKLEKEQLKTKNASTD